MNNNDKFPQVRISLPARLHLEEIVAYRIKLGLSATLSSVANEAIMSMPNPNGHTPAEPGPCEEEKS